MVTDRGKEIFRHLLQFHALPAHTRMFLLLRDQKASATNGGEPVIAPVDDTDLKLTRQESAAMRQALMPLRTESSHSLSAHSGILPWAREVSLKRHLFIQEGELRCKIGIPIHRANQRIKGYRIVLLTMEDDTLRSQTLLDDDSYRYRKWPRTTITFRWHIDGELDYPEQFEGLSAAEIAKLSLIGWRMDPSRQAISAAAPKEVVRRIPYLVGETFLDALHLLDVLGTGNVQLLPQAVAQAQEAGMIVDQQLTANILLTVSMVDDNDLTPLYRLGATRQTQLAQATPPVDSLAKLAFLRRQRLSEFEIPVNWLLRWSFWAFLMGVVTGSGRRGADGAIVLAEVLGAGHYRELIEIIPALDRLDFSNQCQQACVLPEIDPKIITDFSEDDFDGWFDSLVRLKRSTQ